MTPPTGFGCGALVAAANDDVNVPLAVGVIIVSTIAIIGAIVWSVRRRDRYDPSTDDPLLRSLDAVEWYGHDIAPELIAAEPDQRAAVLDKADPRITKAHARLLASSQLEGDVPAWERLLTAVTTTETEYRNFADGTVESTAVTDAAQNLLYRLEQLRDRLG